MRIILFITIITIELQPAWMKGKQLYRNPQKSKIQNETMVRLLSMMQSYYTAGDQRIQRLHNWRAYYENTEAFEEGYIIGEIIERYRRLVEHTKIVAKLKSFTVFGVINRMELGQRLYFEVFHLVNMIHELPRKYGHDPDEEIGAEDDYRDPYKGQAEVEELIDDLEKRERLKKKEAKQRAKEMKKFRDAMAKKGIVVESTTRKKTNPWKLEYGWEIDYEW